MEYVTALFFFASVRSCLKKKTCIMKMYGICCFSFFFATLWKFFLFFLQKFHFSKTTEYFKKNGINGKVG